MKDIDTSFGFPVFAEFPQQGQWLTPLCPMVDVRKGVRRTTAPLVYASDAGRTYIVPSGWATDGASLPWILTCRFDRWDPQYLRSAVLHDFLFSTHLETFRRSNGVFRESLQVEGWRLWRWFAWAVGTPFGWWSYYRTPNLPENDELVKNAGGMEA